MSARWFLIGILTAATMSTAQAQPAAEAPPPPPPVAQTPAASAPASAAAPGAVAAGGGAAANKPRTAAAASTGSRTTQPGQANRTVTHTQGPPAGSDKPTAGQPKVPKGEGSTDAAGDAAAPVVANTDAAGPAAAETPPAATPPEDRGSKTDLTKPAADWHDSIQMALRPGFALAVLALFVAVLAGLVVWLEVRRLNAARLDRINIDSVPTLSKQLDTLVEEMSARMARLEGEVRRLTAERDAAEQRVAQLQAGAAARPGDDAAAQRPGRPNDFFETGARLSGAVETEPAPARGAASETQRRTPQVTPPRTPPHIEELPWRAEPSVDMQALDRDPRTRRLIQDYNRAAAGDRVAVEQFNEIYDPIPVSIVDAGSGFQSGADADLWFLSVDRQNGFGIVVLGAEPIKTWDMYYRSLGGRLAKDKFGSVFSFEEGEVLALAQPAWARRTSERNFLKLRNGVLKGV